MIYLTDWTSLRKMESKPRNRYALMILLLLASILSLTPTLAHADQQPSVAIVITATGEATPTNSGGNQLASLTLSGNGYINSNKWLIIENVAGSLKIGSTNYTITAGHGSVNTYGEIAIFADTNAGQLVLYGTESGDGLTFDTPSQLTSVASLSLNGSMNQTNESVGPASNSTVTNSANGTPSSTNRTQSNTTHALASITANSTQSSTLNTTASATNSSVVPTTSVNNTNATTTHSSTTYSTTFSPSTINSTTMSSTTLTGSGNVPLNPPPQGNVTITVTQYVSQTASTTQTVANVTISYTLTTTVANTTTTVGNVTSAVTTTTGT